MLKVLIVDDDLLIRTNIKFMLDWEKYGFMLCTEASNGCEAINIINKENPDIIVTDVRMPTMDGLQLSSVVNSMQLNCKMIMLSSYDDYEYVRSALKNGAVDYILKHNLNKEVLLDVLMKTKQILINGKTDIPNDHLTNILAIKEKFIVQLLTGLHKNEDVIIHNIKALEMKIETKNVMAIIMVIDDYKVITSEGNLRNNSLLEFAIVNITNEILNDSENGVVCHIANERFVVLLSFGCKRSAAAIDVITNSLLERIAVCLRNFLNISVSFSIGCICERLINVSKSYENAEKSLYEKFYAGKNCILKNTKPNAVNSPLVGLDIASERQILLNIKLKDWDNLYKKLEELFNRIKNEKISPVNSQMVFNDLLNIINRICKENDISLSKVYSDNAAPHSYLANIETLDEIKRWIYKLYSRLIEFIESESRASNSEYVRKAINFINKHYSENIALVNVSEEIKISIAYLSTLFKEEMGIGFSEYLCNLRLDKAKALLEEKKHEMKDIVSMCGFNNYAYFFNTFKKKTGSTPKEFVNNLVSAHKG